VIFYGIRRRCGEMDESISFMTLLANVRFGVSVIEHSG
jgi:hypothetical protein